MRRAILVLAVLGAAGCGGGLACPDLPESSCRSVVRGACVMVDPADPPAISDDALSEHIERGIAAGASYWGADPESIVRNVAIIAREHPAWRNGQLELASASAECRMIYLSNGYSPTGNDRPGCVELLLPHEIGHLALPADHAHEDPRWQGVEAAGAMACGD